MWQQFLHFVTFAFATQNSGSERGPFPKWGNSVSVLLKREEGEREKSLASFRPQLYPKEQERVSNSFRLIAYHHNQVLVHRVIQASDRASREMRSEWETEFCCERELRVYIFA